MVTTFAALPRMRERGSGTIINIASRAATLSVPGSMSYTDSKTAIVRATECIQQELEIDGLGEKVQVYSIHPGGVPTVLANGLMIWSIYKSGS